MPSNRPYIHLIRHGRSALEVPPGRMTAPQVCEWIDRYNDTGIAADSHPPAALVEEMAGVDLVVCSDYPRAVESARRICPGCTPQIDRVFREAGRPLNSALPVKLPLMTWVRFSVPLWRMGLISGDESIGAARRRSRQAAALLVGLAETHGRVLCVGHGMFNRMIARELRRSGWQGAKISGEHWTGGRWRKG